MEKQEVENIVRAQIRASYRRLVATAEASGHVEFSKYHLTNEIATLAPPLPTESTTLGLPPKK